MKKQISKVSIVHCSSYEQKKVDFAVMKALDLIDFDFSDYAGKKVLIKPNVVGCFPKTQEASTTNPAVVEAICKVLKKHGCKIFIADSPFTEPESSFKAAGVDKIAKKYGKLIIFEQSKLRAFSDGKAKVWKKQNLPKILWDVDLVIDVPKLKTHSLTKFTGAIKNLYGCIPGGLKQRLHNKARGDKEFSKILVDVYQNIVPKLNIMDGIIGMEGEGPTSGKSVNSNLVLASKNSVALDIAASKIIGYNPRKIYAIADSIKRKLYPSYKINVVGVKKLPKINFEKPTSQQVKKVRNMIRNLFRERPIVCDTTKCTKCERCKNHCPAKAISMNGFPVIDKKKCIRCFCCIEICPENALGLKK